MHRFLTSALLSTSALQAQEEPKPLQADLRQHSSLTLGYQEGIRAARKQMAMADIDQEAFLKGFLLGLQNKDLPLSPEEVREAMADLQSKITLRETETAKKNKEAGERFLLSNQSKEGVITTPSGLQYQVIKPGEGEPLGEEGLAGRQILVAFKGTLPNGSEFSASGEFGPSKMKLDDTIAGFREALTLMPKGAQWKVFVPAELAYGDQRRSSEIGPNQLLIFEIELVDLVKEEVEGQ